MKELLDEPLKEQKPQLWQGFALVLYWKVYMISFLAAFGILLMLFMRSTMGSDLDAVLAILILWGIMANLFSKASKNVFWGILLSFFIVFFVFLNYAPSLVAGLHGMNNAEVTRWKWSHYELVFGQNFFTFNLNDAMLGRRHLSTTIIESTIWFLFYVFLTVIITELMHLFTIYSTKSISKK